MIPVALDHGNQILLVPLLEKHIIIHWPFAPVPRIKTLILNKKTHLVTKLQQLRSRQIMSGTDRIASHLF